MGTTQIGQGIDGLVRTYGHAVLAIGAEPPEPSFSYTVGLWESGWPEVIVFGLGPQVAQPILNHLVQLCRQRGAPPAAGEVVLEISNLPVGFADFAPEHQQNYMAQALYHCERHGGTFAGGVQMVLSDRKGLLPGQPGYDHQYMDKFSPRLGRAPWDFSRSMGSA